MSDSSINVQPSSGASPQLKPQYYDTDQPMVLVPVMDIRDASSSAKEEVAQFSAGGFFASGSFWLGLERLMTVGHEDSVFLCSIAFFICGSILGIVGLRQTMRRVSRLERYLPNDKPKTSPKRQD